MPNKPLIGCTTYLKAAHQAPQITMYGLMPAYTEAIRRAGGIPMLIPLGLGEDELTAIFDRLDGLLLPGGGDILPNQYGGQMHETVGGIHEDRDRVELFLARKAVKARLPLLAICRGHQVLNVALGGSLWEDVQQLMPNGIKHAFFDEFPRNKIIHSVCIESNTKLAACLQAGEVPVNSLHHQGIKQLAPELTATATAPDGLIEAVEISEHPFAIGVQWHPECLVDDEPMMLGLFEGLVSAAKA